ncbi:trypsin-like peptidase domain-containing protein [Piscirickettsia litoralis]|uniref:trypsin-like peptidase domain-containing protein n=1 Tax=Piscirickettsia litoralis TaxID=1891921 RepID=UPI002285CE4C|nr:trypsin-like peptidase domain-containing protein [Piscirickettsia litoralis]
MSLKRLSIVSSLVFSSLMVAQSPSWAARVAPAQAPLVSYAVAVKHAAPAVVSIYTSKNQRGMRGGGYGRQMMPFSPYGQGMQPDAMSLGSGVIMDEDGYIVTNYHVIRNADQIDIALHDGRKTQAKVVGTDPEVDLAILKINLKNSACYTS